MQYQPLIPDRYFHIYNRGNNSEDIFIEEKNYQFFLHLIIVHLLPVCDIFAYCMLKNHFHLIIKTKEKQEEKRISKAFSNFFNAYAKAINKAYGRSGSLFQDRFKRKLVTEENYLINLILYVHLNPESHKLVEDFRNYKHSSYSHYLEQKSSILKKEDIFALFGSMENFIAVHEAKRKTGSELDFHIEQ